MPNYRTIAILCCASALLAAPSRAEQLTFTVALDGMSMPAPTGSAATGKARVKVDTTTQRVSVDMDVRGIALADLWDALVAKPIGPVHFHKYGSHQHRADDVVLILPLPYGPDYHATGNGFRIATRDYDYGSGAKLLGSLAPFDDFVAAMKSGQIVLNVHTDKFHDGEIAGTVLAGTSSY